MPASRMMIALAAMTMPAGLVWAQDDADQPEPKEVTIGEQGSEQDPLSGREPALLVDPKRNPVVKQIDGLTGLPSLSIKLDRRVLGIAPGEPLPALRREGETLRKRDGRLLPPGDRGYAIFIADADPEAGDDQPVAMVLAPCMTLESMERLYEDRGENLRFTMTGEVHTYRGVNYLLPTSQPKPWLVAEGQEPKEIEVEEPAGEEGGGAAGDASTEEGGGSEEAAADEKPNEQKSADDVLRDLLEKRDDTPTPGETAPGNDGTAAPVLPPSSEDGPGTLADPLLIGLDTDQPQAELKSEGQFIVARTGRLIRSASGSQALFVLDSDKRGAPESPMIIQACKLLETMEDTVLEQGDAVPFVVTGQVFVYRGANYLLPTIVRREFDRGNLE